MLKPGCTGKKAEDDLFDLIDPTKVNKHLQQLMPGLTIKVFRTYNASITLSRLLKETDSTKDVAGKKAQARRRSCVAHAQVAERADARHAGLRSTTKPTRKSPFCATIRRA